MKIGITINKKSYTPEAFAYKKYLTNLGHEVELAPNEDLSINNDINIYFLGKKTKKTSAIEVHEYHSLSTPPLAKLKDYIKSKINCTPNGRIFLNDFVKKNLNFNDNTKYIYRDMGVDDIFFDQPPQKKEFDIVYCGSIQNRKGLIDRINKLSDLGLSICLIGKIENHTYKQLNNKKNIHCTGQLSRSEIPVLYAKSHCGLNYTPDIYPYNQQTSTKTLEYLATGINCLTNKYKWINHLEEKTRITLIDIDDDNLIQKIRDESNIKISRNDFEWTNILKKCDLENFLINL